MQERRVRLSLPLTQASISGHACLISDLSLSGALLLMAFAPPVDSTWALTLEGAGGCISLEAKVIRLRFAGAYGPAPYEWKVGVAFVNVTAKTRQAIPRIYTLMR